MVKPEINSPAERTPAPHRLNKNNEIWFRTGRAFVTNPSDICGKLSLMERNQVTPG
jgi:hypothetical protein